MFLWSTLYANAIGFPASYIMPRAMPPLYRYSPRVRWAATVAILAAIALAGSTVVSLLMASSGTVSWSGFPRLWLSSLKMSLVLTLAFGIGSVIYYQHRYRLEETTLALRTRELEKERAEKLATEARLQSLESRIHPHFLFNALNSVSALIREQPELAERQVERISRFLRFALDRGSSGLVPLSDELRIVADYLEIERTRFGERLSFDITAPPEALAVQVPALAVQTLVENSVKFAVAPRREGGAIHVSASLEGSRLAVEVRDDGPGFEPALRPSGHGLDLLQGRLAAHFGAAAALQFRNGSGMSVTMEIPCGPS
jgi:sensor histidine kinase YesM